MIFKKTMFFVLYFINWPNFIVWLRLFIEILVNTCFEIVCFTGCDIIDIEIIFLTKAVFCMTKKSRQKLKYLENKKSF